MPTLRVLLVLVLLAECLCSNKHLAAFDGAWNLVEDVAVTSFSPADLRFPGRPWVILHNDKLYVSYDVDDLDPDTHQERIETQQAFVSIYSLSHRTYLPLVLLQVE